MDSKLHSSIMVAGCTHRHSSSTNTGATSSRRSRNSRPSITEVGVILAPSVKATQVYRVKTGWTRKRMKKRMRTPPTRTTAKATKKWILQSTKARTRPRTAASRTTRRRGLSPDRLIGKSQPTATCRAWGPPPSTISNTISSTMRIRVAGTQAWSRWRGTSTDDLPKYDLFV